MGGVDAQQDISFRTRWNRAVVGRRYFISIVLEPDRIHFQAAGG
jgi:hypothetical protein